MKLTAQQLDIPARSWLPDWAAVGVVFLIMLPVTMLNGMYTGCMVEVSNTLGAYTEDITIGFYAAAAGMAVAYPIVPKILGAFSSKSMLLVNLTLQFLLSWACARSGSTDLMVFFSFVIGFLKGFLMLWIIRRIKLIFSPDDVRSEFYAYFYPIVFGGGQVSMVVTALLAYHYDWKYMYYFMMVLLMLGILAVIILFRHDRPSKGIALKELHLREMLIIATGLLMLVYVLTYGRILDWMASGRICLYIVIAPLLIGLFVWEQFHSPNPYVSLKPLFQWKAILGYLYMVIVMLFSTSTTLQTNYLTTILHVDNTHAYTLYVWLLPGYALGAFVCFWWFRWQRWRFRFLIAGGMACFVVLFVVEDLNAKYLLSNAFFLISFRAVLAPVLASAFYSNALYRLQQRYFSDLSENFTLVDPLAASRYASSLGSSLAQGHGIDEAMQLATNTLYATLQQQSMLLALKHMLGWLVVATLVIAVVSRFIPFHKTIRVPVIRTGEDMV